MRARGPIGARRLRQTIRALWGVSQPMSPSARCTPPWPRLVPRARCRVRACRALQLGRQPDAALNKAACSKHPQRGVVLADSCDGWLTASRISSGETASRSAAASATEISERSPPIASTPSRAKLAGPPNASPPLRHCATRPIPASHRPRTSLGSRSPRCGAMTIGSRSC